MADGRRSSWDKDRDRDNRSSDSDRKEGKYDEPPNSRLFIVCGKTLSEDDFRESFQRFGTIEEIWMVRDRTTGDPKGVTYIKFTKTSEAALAMEEMNGKCIGGHPRPLKVLIAHSRDQGSKREMNEEERLLRLFVVVPKTYTETDIRNHFSEFGEIEHISVVRDRQTKESKGFAYVKYTKMSHAAKAFESCERSFKAVFADPKPQRQIHAPPHLKFEQESFTPLTTSAPTGHIGLGIPTPGMHAFDFLPHNTGQNPDGTTRLTVIASPNLNQDQLWKLFDIVPGLDYCDLRKPSQKRPGQQSRGFAIVVYNNPQSAAYALQKLHGFEYPPGERLIVRFDTSDSSPLPSSHGPGHGMGPSSPYSSFGVRTPAQSHPMLGLRQQTSSSGTGASAATLPKDLAALAETIVQATTIIQAAGLAGAQGALRGVSSQPKLESQSSNGLMTSQLDSSPSSYDPSYCSVKLPSPQPLAPTDSHVAERLFIVCIPTPPPTYVLKDVFGRFGGLIDIYMLHGKNCGYAKYADKAAAEQAILTLHGQDVCGARLKVMEADPQDKSNDSVRKRLRMDLEH